MSVILDKIVEFYLLDGNWLWLIIIPVICITMIFLGILSNLIKMRWSLSLSMLASLVVMIFPPVIYANELAPFTINPEIITLLSMVSYVVNIIIICVIGTRIIKKRRNTKNMVTKPFKEQKYNNAAMLSSTDHSAMNLIPMNSPAENSLAQGYGQMTPWSKPMLYDVRNKKQYTLQKGDNTIGRDKRNNIILDDLKVSEKHAIIHVGQNEITILHHSSTNPTRVNGYPIEKQVIYRPDSIIVGETLLKIMEMGD